MTKEQPNLTETFACVAQVGDWTDVRVGDALVAAVAPEINAPGGCNEGFLRDDALLMVTLIAGYDESETTIYPWDWYDIVVDAKHGDASSIVAFLIGNAECPFPQDYPCQFTKMFPRHLVQEIDAPNYGPAFDAATELVGAACEDFIPQ